MRAVDVSHGTSVLGQILMADNRTGGIGIAPAAKGRVVSSWRSNQNNVASAILDAGVNMKLGDVLLLEAQEFNPMMDVTDELLAQNRGLLPVEVTQANYDAIRTLTGAGVIVVEAGANGTFDLDTYVSFSDKQIFKRSSNDFRDSGAIMVGAGSSAGSSTSPHTRMGWSNFGSRIDVFAWGENIDTTTSASDAGTTGVHNQYTTTFAGTSGASPIITGAALIVQGIAAKTPKGRKLLPLQVRKILTTSGTPSATPASDKIGVMPDLKAIISGGSIKAALGA
jgi:serine protease